MFKIKNDAKEEPKAAWITGLSYKKWGRGDELHGACSFLPGKIARFHGCSDDRDTSTSKWRFTMYAQPQTTIPCISHILIIIDLAAKHELQFSYGI